MRALVCVKYVPTEAGAAMDAAGRLVRRADAQQLNPADEAALALALQLCGGENVTVLCMGAAFCARPLHELLERGAARAVLLSGAGFAGADSLATARTLAAAAKRLGPFDLILCGRRTLDGETGQVPAELAALLGLPCLTNVTAAVPDGAALRCTRLLESGAAALRCVLPAVLTLCEYSCVLPAPSLAGIRAARSRAAEVWDESALDLPAAQRGLAGSPTRVQEIGVCTAGRRHVRRTDRPDEGAAGLAALLREAMR